jgi:hypothetical protein
MLSRKPIDWKKHVSHILATLGLNNRVQIALLVHDAALEDGQECPPEGMC